jgi:hypothetical protein
MCHWFLSTSTLPKITNELAFACQGGLLIPIEHDSYLYGGGSQDSSFYFSGQPGLSRCEGTGRVGMFNVPR